MITQFHTSVMFAPNIVGTANATVAGWGNLGGGVTQVVMPLLFSGFLSMGVGSWWGSPASFDVLTNEIRGLGLNMRLEKRKI